MCSGCITCGYRTNSGSGKSLTRPENVAASNSSSVASQGFIALPLNTFNFNRRQLDRRIEPDFRNQVRIQLNVRKLFSPRSDFCEAGVELREEFFHVETFAAWPVLRQVASAAAINL